MVRVDAPEPTTVVGLKPKLNPVGPVADRDTVSVNPFRAVTVTVEVPEAPCTVLTGEEALIVKSGGGDTLTLIGTECDSEPLVPVAEML